MRLSFKSIFSKRPDRNKILISCVSGVTLIILGYLVVGNLFGGTVDRNTGDLAQLAVNDANTIELIIVSPPRIKKKGGSPRLVVKTDQGQAALEANLPVIDKAVICLAVAQQGPAGIIQQKISSSTRKVFCWARILNGRGKKIRYIWYLDGVPYPSRWLYITNDRFRSWCPKYIPRKVQGIVRVEIVDQTGRILKSLETQIRPAKSSVSRRG